VWLCHATREEAIVIRTRGRLVSFHPPASHCARTMHFKPSLRLRGMQRQAFHPTADCDHPQTVSLVTLFLLVTSPLGVHTVELDRCGDRLRNAHEADWNLTHSDPPPPLYVTYEQCLAECGTGLGSITWDVFPQSITAWFLPWIVLAFQIPFGAKCEPLISTLSHRLSRC